jgi:hypothetical protein
MASLASLLAISEVVGQQVLAGFNPTSPRRYIQWSINDASGNPAVGTDGQPLVNSLTPQVTVEERGMDRLRITDQPVEKGAAISDHAYKMPAELIIRGGFSFAYGTPPGNIVPTITDSSLLSTLYQTLLALQDNRSLCNVQTGKRLYQNMLLELLVVETDQRSENVLEFEATFRQLLIAETQTVGVPSQPSVMKTPQLNQAPVNVGTTQLQPGSAINVGAANSVLPPTQELHIEVNHPAGTQ